MRLVSQVLTLIVPVIQGYLAVGFLHQNYHKNLG